MSYGACYDLNFIRYCGREHIAIIIWENTLSQSTPGLFSENTFSL